MECNEKKLLITETIEIVCKVLDFMELKTWNELPPEQRMSCIEVIRRQGIDKLQKVFSPGNINPYVGLEFTHIFIGVEPDGYAHS